MRKTNLFIAIFICLLGVSILFGNDSGAPAAKSPKRSSLKKSGHSAELGDTNSEKQKSSGKAMEADKSQSSASPSKVEKAKNNENADLFNNTSDENNDSDNTGLATLPNGPAYVGVNTSLNLRNAIWGKIIASLYNNEKITITGRDGDWYKVSTSKGNGYVYAQYVFSSPNKKNEKANSSSSSKSGSSKSNNSSKSDNSNSSNKSSNNKVEMNVSGDSLQGKIVSAAQQLIQKYSSSGSFPYASGTEGGNKGCAQVATTALCAAGALPATHSSGGLGYASLGVEETVSLLKKAGWKTAKVPPYQAGDVVVWNPNGRIRGHIGVLITSGNTAQTMHNSSSALSPRTLNVNYYPVAEVIRKS